MNRYLPIRRVYAREVLDSRGNPTIEVEVTVGEGVVGLDGYTARAMVPSGASTGQFEAVELRDQDETRFHGKGVTQAVAHVNEELAEAVLGENALKQSHIDKILCDIDGTENKERVGANAILGVSLAVAKAAAKAMRMPLYQYLGGSNAKLIPVPMMNVINGGKHAENTLDFQEFMIVPVGADHMSQAVRMCTEVYHVLKKRLEKEHFSTGVGDEGGFAPDVKNAKEALRILSESVEEAGYRLKKDICFAIDAAASELYQKEKDQYYFQGESLRREIPVYRSSQQMIEYYQELIQDFPVISIEDPLHEEDWMGWKMMTEALGQQVQLVGDDLFVTNTKRLKYGIEHQAANAILIKVNQIGTLTEAMDAIEMAQKAGYRTIISHRSGETEDDFIADLAVACNAGQIKTGAPCRSERTAKYNRLLRIEEELRQSTDEEPIGD